MQSSNNGKHLRGGVGTSDASQADRITPEMWDEAKTKGAKPPQAKAPQNEPEKKKDDTTMITTVAPPQNPTVAGLWAAMRKAKEKGEQARTKETQSVKVARETANNEEMVRDFLGMVQEVEELLVTKISSDGKPEQEARDQVNQLGTGDQVKLLGEYANNDPCVQDMLASLEFINGEPRTRDALYGAIDWWYKPLTTIGTMEALDEFLTDCLKAGVVNLTYGRKPSDQAVTIMVIGQNDKYYTPKPEKDEAVAGWTFCKEAEEWALKNWDDMKLLRDQATPGLTPYLISNKGYQGNLFVPLSLHEAVLLEVSVQGGWTSVRCIGSVGLEGDSVPDGKEYQWDNHRKTVGNPTSDAWIWIAEAVSQMAKDQYEASLQRFNAKQEKSKPLMKGTTVGSHFKDQGLTMVVQGDEKIVVAIYRPDHSWNKKEGFLGCRVRWQKGILVEEIVYDHFFPKHLIGMVMPVTIDPETLRLKLDPLPRYNDKQKAEYTAWKMLEVFLNARLTQEERALSKNTETASAQQEGGATIL